ncbi:MAG: CDP-alcohol phosphatidyltransferase family protein [Muribaculum sp.]|nr:CDP-alcohol phosphatidyltransferase family protein [Muribaculum sp.]
MLKKIVSSIPNTITCLSLFFGCIATVMAFHFYEPVGSLYGYQWAWICIGIAALCDFCDGASARLLHAYSNLGKELDSLSDLVSFGVAPGMLVFNYMSQQPETPLWLSFTAFLIPVMGELRLARFNIDDRQTTSFLGMPIPANAIFWIGYVACMLKYGYIGAWPMAAIILGMSLTMVMDNLKMFSLKFKNFKLRENLRRYIILIAAVGFVIVDGTAGFAWTILFYLILSIIPTSKSVA